MKAGPLWASDGDRVPEESDGLLRPGIQVSVKYGFIRGEEGNHPCPAPCAWWGGSIPDPGVAPGATGPCQQLSGEDRIPGRHRRPVLRRPPAGHCGHRPSPCRARPPRNPSQRASASGRSWPPTLMNPLQAQEEGPDHGPSRGPSGPAGQTPQERHRQRVGGDMA